MDEKKDKATLWEAQANPRAKGFGDLRLSDPDLAEKAREALRAAAREQKSNPRPFDVPVDSETLRKSTGRP